jgi:hypothetical protein
LKLAERRVELIAVFASVGRRREALQDRLRTVPKRLSENSPLLEFHGESRMPRGDIPQHWIRQLNEGRESVPCHGQSVRDYLFYAVEIGLLELRKKEHNTVGVLGRDRDREMVHLQSFGLV